jgi:hypothetical protein
MPQLVTTGLYTRTSYSFSEAVDQVLGDLGLRDNTVITSGDVGNWMNAAQRRLAVDTHAFIASWNIQTVSGTAEYVMPSDANGTALSILEATYQGAPLRPVNVAQLYSYNYRWHTAAASTPLGYYQHGAGSIGLYPAPSASGTADLVVWAIAIPPQVTAPDDLFYVPHGCEDALIAYAELRAAIKDAFGEGKDRIPIFEQEWKEWKLRAQQIAREAQGAMITRLGEDALIYGNPWPYPFGWWWDPTAVATPRS